MNKSAVSVRDNVFNRSTRKTNLIRQTMHVLHQGRAEYTLIAPGSPPKIERKVRMVIF